MAVSSPLIFKLISAKELTGGNRNNPWASSRNICVDCTSHISHSSSLSAIQGSQEDKWKLKQPQGSQLQTCSAQEVASPLPASHWTSHGLPTLWVSHVCGYYVRSYGLTHVFLEVMDFLDSIQRINEDSMINRSFERTLLFSQLYPVWTVKGDDSTFLGSTRPQWN